MWIMITSIIPETCQHAEIYMNHKTIAAFQTSLMIAAITVITIYAAEIVEAAIAVAATVVPTAVAVKKQSFKITITMIMLLQMLIMLMKIILCW